MPFINDPQTIKYRTALQAERDVQLTDLGVFALDLFESMARRKQLNVPLITNGDAITLNGVVRSIANVHFELHSGDLWKKQNENLKSAVVQGVSENILKQILQSTTPLCLELPAAACSLLEEEFKKHLAAEGKTYPNL